MTGNSNDVFATLMTVEDLGDDRFIAPPSPEEGGRMFGGQLLAQGLVAASRTIDDDRNANSLHGFFLRAGSVDVESTITIERVRDGRSFSTRSVRVEQLGREIFRAMVSFHVPEDGLLYSPDTMPSVPPPDAVAKTYNDFALESESEEEWFAMQRPVDIRYINAPTTPEGTRVTESQKMWMRIDSDLNDDPVIHAAGLAYLSDTTLIDHALLPHGYRWQDDRLSGASLDHTIYFHEPTRVDEWILFDQRVEFTGSARGTASGTMYAANSCVVSSCIQEGLIRWDG